jgi:hypothetical protein
MRIIKVIAFIASMLVMWAIGFGMGESYTIEEFTHMTFSLDHTSARGL